MNSSKQRVNFRAVWPLQNSVYQNPNSQTNIL